MFSDIKGLTGSRKLFARTAGASAILAAATMLAPVSASAFTLDGILTTGAGADNYTTSFDLTFELDGKKDSDPDKIVNGGKIRIGRDGPAGDVFILVEVPIDVVDNVYGTSAATDGSGWVKADGRPQGHSLRDLLGSDKLEFDLATIGSPVEVSVNYDRDRDDGAGVIEYATSLQHNLANGFNDTDDNSPDPITGLTKAEEDDWVQAVQYEMQFAGSLFEEGKPVPADLANFFLHASPNKGKFDNKIKITCTGDCDPGTTTTTDVPEPGTLSLLGAGLLGLALYRRRRSAKA